jgi:methylated-DNA-[protein]-cysteine S-methyltransferase
MIQWTEITLVDGVTVRLVSSDSGLKAIDFTPWRELEGERRDGAPVALEAARQLRAYFAGELRRFDLPLDMRGTAFQMSVWNALLGIPYGETRSYLRIAEAIGSPLSVRAVGAANGANPIPIVVPCHRVIGSSGKLVGYGGGLPLKKRLLELEGSRALPLWQDRK